MRGGDPTWQRRPAGCSGPNQPSAALPTGLRSLYSSPIEQVFLDTVKATAKASQERVEQEEARVALATEELRKKAQLTEEALLAEEQAG